MKALSFVILGFFLSGCGPSERQSFALSEPAAEKCSAEYAKIRNPLVNRMDRLWLTIRLESGNPKPETVAKAAALADDLEAFLRTYETYVCQGLVLTCLDEGAPKPGCYMDPSRSKYVETTIENSKLKEMVPALRNYRETSGPTEAPNSTDSI